MYRPPQCPTGSPAPKRRYCFRRECKVADPPSPPAFPTYTTAAAGTHFDLSTATSTVGFLPLKRPPSEAVRNEGGAGATRRIRYTPRTFGTSRRLLAHRAA